MGSGLGCGWPAAVFFSFLGGGGKPNPVWGNLEKQGSIFVGICVLLGQFGLTFMALIYICVYSSPSAIYLSKRTQDCVALHWARRAKWVWLLLFSLSFALADEKEATFGTYSGTGSGGMQTLLPQYDCIAVLNIAE